MKKTLDIYDAPPPHWVGDGFPVRSMFSYHTYGAKWSPFLLLDYAGPAQFEPASRPRGVGQHPHRGFETVTIVYQGEVEHQDSTGAGGVIGPGDVQWMTAASGILHEEFHSRAFTRSGGTLEMVQLWVNLSAKDKMSKPAYQTLLDKHIPSVELANEAGRLRVIAGEFQGGKGPARTFTPMNVWDIRLNQNGVARFDTTPGHTTILLVLRGTVLLNGSDIARENQLVYFERQGNGIEIEANNDATLLLMSGEPINEPIVGHGPFVMNCKTEILEAFNDFNGGAFGQIERD